MNIVGWYNAIARHCPNREVVVIDRLAIGLNDGQRERARELCQKAIDRLVKVRALTRTSSGQLAVTTVVKGA